MFHEYKNLEINNQNTEGKKVIHLESYGKILLNNSWAKGEITKELTKYLDLNDNENTTCQCVGCKKKSREKCIVLNAFMKMKKD